MVVTLLNHLKTLLVLEEKKNKKKKTKKIVYKSEMAKTNDELRKISKRLNQDSINKFKKERNVEKRMQ